MKISITINEHVPYTAVAVSVTREFDANTWHALPDSGKLAQIDRMKAEALNAVEREMEWRGIKLCDGCGLRVDFCKCEARIIQPSGLQEHGKEQ